MQIQDEAQIAIYVNGAKAARDGISHQSAQQICGGNNAYMSGFRDMQAAMTLRLRDRADLAMVQIGRVA